MKIDIDLLADKIADKVMEKIVARLFPPTIPNNPSQPYPLNPQQPIVVMYGVGQVVDYDPYINPQISMWSDTSTATISSTKEEDK